MAALLCLALLALAACDWQAFAPGNKCWWTYSASAVTVDTVRNTTPDNGSEAWRPYVLVARQYWTDSARVCR